MRSATAAAATTTAAHLPHACRVVWDVIRRRSSSLTTEEVAALALFLASDDASFVHGAPVLVDGGWTLS
jgi:NAD(P)-dependent dehydrogenase (short-subunit alcohol dehydrogenase family)